MWCWIERIQNEEVLRRLGIDRQLLVKMRERQMRFVGHVVGRGKIEDLILTGRRISGGRATGRQREKYKDGIIRTVGDGSKAAQILQMTR